jgi:P pilus assembly chaperone PapD
MQKSLRIFFTLFLCIFLSSAATAGINVSPAIIKFDKGKIKQDFRVFNNSGEDTAYVQIKVETIENIGTPEEKSVPTPNPSESGILVSPTKLALGPKANRVIRVRLTKPPSNVERRYRLVVTPVEGKAIPVKTAEGEEISAAVRVVIGYAVLAIVPPAGQ